MTLKRRADERAFHAAFTPARSPAAFFEEVEGLELRVESEAPAGRA